MVNHAKALFTNRAIGDRRGELKGKFLRVDGTKLRDDWTPCGISIDAQFARAKFRAVPT